MIRVLGTVEIDGHGPIRSRAQRVVLAMLVIHRGATVSSDRLADLVWGDDLPEHPSASLQNHVSRLRKLLPPDVDLQADEHGYRVLLAADQLDLTVFDDRFEAACAASGTAVLDAADAGLALWRGEPFADLDGDPSAIAVTARCIERHDALEELRAAALLSLGRLPEAIAELDRLRAAHPLNERVVELLMTAFVDVGRPTEALGAYQRLRNTLVEELGLDPSPRLAALEHAVLLGNSSGASPGGPVATTPEPRSRVPTATGSFVGRSVEVARVSEMIATHRVVTIAGPGGVGKTRLLGEVVNQAESGIPTAWVDLAGVSADGELGEVVAGALGLQPRAGVRDVDRIIDAVGSRSQAVLLDNCEHVVEQAARLVSDLVAAAPGLTVVATSREPLEVAGETVMRLRPLDVADDAVTLFVDRARSAAGDLEFTSADLEVVSEICHRLDGLPLAIELAAGRCAALGVDGLASSLDAPLEILRRRRGEHERHGSLRALVDWSARDLDDDLRATFEATSVFAGPFSAEDAASVIGRPMSTVVPALSDLVARSLVVADHRTGGPTMFRQLVTIRSYAAEALAGGGDLDDVRSRYWDWVLELVETAHAELVGPNGAAADVRVLDAMDDLRVAHRRFVDQGEAARSLRLIGSLDLVVLLHMRSEAIEWAMEAADRFGDHVDPATEQALAVAAIAAWMGGDVDRAERYATRASEVAALELDPRAGQGAAQALGDVAHFRGDNEAGFEHFRRGAEIATSAGDEARSVVALADAATAAAYLGRFDTARDLVAEAAARLGTTAAPAIGAWVAYAQGEVLADEDPDRALDALDTAVLLANVAGAAFVRGVAGLTHASLTLRSGAPHDAVAGFVGLMEAWRSRGARVQQWITLRSVVQLLVKLGEFECAGMVLGAVIGPEAPAEVGGADANRMEAARSSIAAAVPAIDELLARGAALPPDELVDGTLECLRGHLTAG